LNVTDSDVFVLDTYLANDTYLSEIGKKCTLVLFDDNNDIYNTVIPDVIINGNFHAPALNYFNFYWRN